MLKSESSATQPAWVTSPCVKVLFHVDEGLNKLSEPVEVVKRIEDDYEVVDVDGFVFKRKLSSPACKDPEGLADIERPAKSFRSELQVATPRQGILEAGSLELIPGDTTEQHEIDVCTQVQTVCSYGNVDDTLTDRLRELLQPSHRLKFLNSARECCEEQLAEFSRQSSADANGTFPSGLLQTFHQHFLSCLSTALGCCDSGIPLEDGIQEAAALELELQARKCGLQNRLEQLQQEEAVWQALLQEHQTKGETVFDADETPLPSQLPAQEALQQAQRLKGSLQAAQEEARKHLTLQVEALCGVVRGMEEVLAEAEAGCNALQDKYHQEKFRTFPHVDSPARLIRDLQQKAGPSRWAR